MGANPLEDLTLILGKARAGDHEARDDLLALVYEELRQVASRLMRRERADHTLSPTSVVHEAVIRLLGDGVFDGVSVVTVERDWRLTRDWLVGQLGGGDR